MTSPALELTAGDASVTMLWLRPEYVSVTVRDGTLSATAEVCADVMGVGAQLISEMAAEWRGWEGTKQWQSLEGTMRLAASQDRAGHISLQVQLHESLYREGWRVQVTLPLEPGQLDALHRRFSQFEASAPHTV